MSAPAQHSPTPQWAHDTTENKTMLTEHGKRFVKKNWGRIGLIWAWALAAIAAIYGPSAFAPKNYDAPNQRPLTENPSYHNNGQEITLARLLAASNMFNSQHESLAWVSFNSLYDQISNTLDQKVSLFSSEKNAHLNHGTNGKESYHAYIGINKQWTAKEIYISWHLPEPTAEQKKKGAVATHRVRFVLYPGQKSIQRYDQFSNWDEQWPIPYSYDQLQEALKAYEVLFN